MLNKLLFLLLSGLFFLSSACTLRSLIISHGDYVASFYIGQYVSLDRGQKNRLNSFLSGYWDELRCRFGGPLSSDLRSLEQKLKSEITLRERDWILERLSYWQLTLSEGAVQISASLLLSLSPAQWMKLKSRLWEKQKEREERALSQDQSDINERNENWLERLEELYGKLSKDQITTLTSERTAKREDYLRFLHHRHTALQAFVSMVETRIPEQELSGFFLLWLQHPENMRPEKERADYLATRHSWLNRWSDVHRIMSSQQRLHLASELNKLTRDFLDAIPDKKECSKLISIFPVSKPKPQ